MTKNVTEEAWEAFFDAVIRRNIPDGRGGPAYRLAQTSFSAGFIACMNKLRELSMLSGAGMVSDAEGAKILERMHEDAQKFALDLIVKGLKGAEGRKK